MLDTEFMTPAQAAQAQAPATPPTPTALQLAQSELATAQDHHTRGLASGSAVRRDAGDAALQRAAAYAAVAQAQALTRMAECLEAMVNDKANSIPRPTMTPERIRILAGSLNGNGARIATPAEE